jgi:LuxR family maltose regulon positive regulatory protein
VGWLSIDPADNDPARFFDYLLAALGKIDPVLGVSTPSTSEFLRPGFEPLLTVLINKLELLPGPVVLILDDYHLIEEPAIQQGIDFLLDHQPASFHLVLATRADPPLHLSRLRGRNQLNEVRLADLRFTTSEAAAFLNQAMGLSLTPDQVALLASRTEGWIAGLQLAALSLQHQADPRCFVESFTGSTHFILDYLTDEVFQSQPAHIQDFLLRTSVLDRLCGPLCDAVCQSSPGYSQKILDHLEHANLFILPLDERQEWYRYHQLFADLLRQRLGQDQPERIPNLYRRASLWFEQNALPYEAIEYAFSTGDPEHTADLIEGVSQALLMHGKAATLLRWLEGLPPDLLDERLSLAPDHAWALLLCSRPMESIRLCIERAEARSASSTAPPEVAPSPFTVRMLPLRAMLELYRGQPELALDLADQALAHLEAGEVYLRSIANLVQALSISTGDDPLQGSWAFQQIVAAGKQAGNLLVTVLALVSLAENNRKLGRLHQAKIHLEQAVELALDAQGRRLPIAGRALVSLGDLTREWNDLPQARRLTQEGIALFEQSELVGAFQGYLTLARIEYASGDAAASRQAIQQAWRWAQAFDASTLDDQTVALMEMRLDLLQGQTDNARRWAAEQGFLVNASPPLPIPSTDGYQTRLRKYELLVLARLRLAQSQPEQALPLLNSLYAEFERVNRPGMMLEIRLLQAQACRLLDRPAQALEFVEKALAQGQPEGFIRSFLDEGEAVLDLLRQAARRPTASRPAAVTAYLERLLAEAGEPRLPATPPASQTPMLEPLSAREIDVLRLLAGSLSASEIAGELVISTHTVHSHIKSIYAKLDVHSRYQAVVRAKALNLI